MPLQKQSVRLSMGQGIDTKTDPYQVPIGKLQALQNASFQKGLLLQKQEGYGALTATPALSQTQLSNFLQNPSATKITTFNGNLTTISSHFSALAEGPGLWVDKGSYQPIDLSTLALIRNSLNQTQVDSAISSTGLICTVYTEVGPSTTTYKYAVADSVTGQNVVAPTALVPTSGTVNGSPRVFILNGFFIIAFSTSTSHLQYVRISVGSPQTAVAAAIDITTQYTEATTVAFDGVVANNTLYFAWNGNDGGGAIRMRSLSASFVLSTAVVVASGKVATLMSVTADNSTSTPTLWTTFYDLASNVGYALAVDIGLNSVLAATQWTNVVGITNVTATAINNVLTFYYETGNAYSFDSSIATNFVKKNTMTVAGTLGTAITLRDVGLASKAFLLNSNSYVFVIQSSPYQPTYFLVDSTLTILAKFAYENGGPYLILGLPSVTVTNLVAQFPYLNKDLVTSVNKNTNVPAGSQVAGIYAQTGINLLTINFKPARFSTAEIGNNLNVSGGFLWAYDGYLPVEQGFHLWPELTLNTDGTYHGLSTATTGGHLKDQIYYYVATYEWSDNQGNIFRSAPSVPVTITTTGGNTSTNTIKVPTLRLTAKTANPVKIVLYRWSTAQQTYYQVTSLTAPTLNDVTADIVTITDTFADATILGNSILYTTGGVVENIAPSAVGPMALYKSRLMAISAEDPNLLLYSKQVIESTPVEMSDLFTLYVAPTTSAQGNTGPMTALSALDDKLIIFKKNAIYYLVGNGPDNTGANNDFTDPVFVTSTVGCLNQASIVFMPKGLMFQSDKGIWLLNRDLSTRYIGAAVEDYTTSATVTSAVNVPGTNEVRFTLDDRIAIIYDYYFDQWSVRENVAAVSSCLYQDLHTYIDQFGQVYQQAPGTYLDGSTPVLLSFTTAWIDVAGFQGFERAYFFYLLGTYKSPHKLVIQISYDYEPSPSQTVEISPDNFSDAYGESSPYGSAPYFGGKLALEDWRIFFDRQKCEAVQVTIKEIFDPSMGTIAGAGLTLSGLDFVIGIKSGYPRLPASRSVG